MLTRQTLILHVLSAEWRYLWRAGDDDVSQESGRKTQQTQTPKPLGAKGGGQREKSHDELFSLEQ